jgi:hypothetical protein
VLRRLMSERESNLKLDVERLRTMISDVWGAQWKLKCFDPSDAERPQLYNTSLQLNSVDVSHSRLMEILHHLYTGLVQLINAIPNPVFLAMPAVKIKPGTNESSTLYSIIRITAIAFFTGRLTLNMQNVVGNGGPQRGFVTC